MQQQKEKTIATHNNLHESERIMLSKIAIPKTYILHFSVMYIYNLIIGKMKNVLPGVGDKEARRGAFDYQLPAHGKLVVK